MNQGKISVRYAKALFLLAKEKKSINRVNNDISFVFSLGKTISEFKLLLESPIINTSQKIKITEKIFKGQISELTHSFLNLVLKNKREMYLIDISRNFLDLVKKEKGIKTAFLTTAFSIGEEQSSEIKQIIEKHFKSKIEFNEQINDKIIGGFVLRIEDKQYDSSVSTKLKRIRTELVNTTFEKKFIQTV